MKKRLFLSVGLGACAFGLAAASFGLPDAAHAQTRKDSMVLAMALEPPGLDPTAGAASAIAEITLYNIFETLTKVHSDGTVSPLLAESWTVSTDQKTYTFKLRDDVKYQNGEPFSSANVKFSFERAAGEKSTNKDKATFANMASIDTPDARTAVVTLKNPDPDFLFLLGQATAALFDPKSVADNNTKPVGTGPYQLESWTKGSSLTLAKSPTFRAPASIKLNKATFRFIGDPAAQIASLLAGDVDAFPRVTPRGIDQFKSDPRFQVLIGGSRAKTILSINNGKAPLNDARVRRAIAAAIDRKAVIAGAGDGYGDPIGSHYAPTAFGYIDTTGINPYDPEKAKALLKEAGVATPLNLSLKLPPVPYARQGGEVIAAQLAKVGIVARIENVEWAQWLDGVFKNRNYDLTIVSHVEPFDLGNYAKTDYYWNYDSPKFREVLAEIRSATNDADRARHYRVAQTLLATDAVNGFLYCPQWISVANKNVKGLWKDMPIFANDLSALSWQ